MIALALPATVWSQTASPVTGMPEDLLPELRPILRAALDRSPQMISSAITVSQTEASRYSSDSALWPHLGGSATYGVSSQSTKTAGVKSSSDSTGLSYSVGLGQPIFQWGALKYNAQIGRISVKIAEKQYGEAYRLLAGTLRSQYLTLIYKRAALRYAESSLKLAGTTLATEEAKLREGTISGGDLIGPRLSFADAHLTFDRAVADLASSKRVFMRLAGLTELADESIPLEVAKPPHSAAVADELLHAFLRDGAGVTNQGKIYLMMLKQNDLSYRIARTGLYPKFSASMNYGLAFSSGVDSLGRVIPQSAVASNSYGISTSWTMFDGFATRGAKLSVLAGRRALNRVLQSYAETAMDTAQTMHQQVQFSARALELAEQRYALTKDGAIRLQEDLALGLTSTSAVDSSNATLLSAQITLVYSRSEFLNRWADFVSHTGADPAMANLPARYVRSTK